MLIMPPATADSAASVPASGCAAIAIAAVTANCHATTVRIGLRKTRSMAFDPFAPRETEKV
jgi:hypothetical protein